MINSNLIYLIQIILSLLLIGLIMLQAKGSGVGSTFGGNLGFYRSRRGFERILFAATIVISALFLILSIVRLLL